jgi:capsular polysaccharide biosynthesis protein
LGFVPDLHRQRTVGVDAPRDSSIADPTSGRRAFGRDDELDLGWYTTALRRRWKLLLAGAVVGAAGALGLASARPILYEGVSSLLVVPPSRLSPNAGPPTVTAATFRAILENESTAAEVITESGLDKPPNNLTPQSFVDRALVVEDERGTNIVHVRVRLREAAAAADASRRIAAKAILLTRQLTDQEGSSVQEQLSKHLADAEKRMTAAEAELLAYQQQAQVELVKEDSQALLKERGELLKLVISIEAEKSMLQTAEAEIKKQERFLPARRALGAEEALRRTDDTKEIIDPSNAFVNPVYQSLDYQIANSRTKLAGLEQHRTQLMVVRKVGGAELEKLTELYKRQINLARLQTTFDLTKRLHSELAIRFEQSRTQGLGNSAQLQIVSNAIPPDRPLGRQRAQWTVLGLVAGLLFAGLVVLFVESQGSARRE